MSQATNKTFLAFKEKLYIYLVENSKNLNFMLFLCIIVLINCLHNQWLDINIVQAEPSINDATNTVDTENSKIDEKNDDLTAEEIYVLTCIVVTYVSACVIVAKLSVDFVRYYFF